MIGIFNNLIQRFLKRSKEKDGMTLVEVVIAFLIIAIVSTVLVRGTITGVNTARINKSKTEALAIANEKIEILRAFDYSEIPIIDPGDSGYDQWIEDNEQLAEDVYEVNYYVTWVSGDETGYKQLRVTVEGRYMTIPLEVITQLYPPTGEEATIGNIYPPPDDLAIFSDEGEGALREIILNWVAPDTEKNILRYNIYRDGVFLKNSSIEYCSDYPGDDNAYTYHVTAVYEGEVESVKSNSVTTGTPWLYPPPEDLEIIGYSGLSINDRAVHLQWSAPDTELTIVEYQIYRDGAYIGSTPDLTYENIIGIDNYTFYVKILYEDDNLSVQSNSVITETPQPPENLTIDSYKWGGPNRAVTISWTAPDTELAIIEYQIYRDGLYIDSTAGLTYENLIGQTDYTFYVKILYEIDYLSDQSNTVTTN